MTELKNIKTSPFCIPKNLDDLSDLTGNLYDSLNVISRRANQMNVVLTQELKEKLNEFSSTTDDLEEIHDHVLDQRIVHEAGGDADTAVLERRIQNYRRVKEIPEITEAASEEEREKLREAAAIEDLTEKNRDIKLE